MGDTLKIYQDRYAHVDTSKLIFGSAVPSHGKGWRPWLQRQLIHLARWFGAKEAVDWSRRIETTTIDFGKLEQAVWECRTDIDRIGQGRAKYLIVGRDRFNQVMTGDGLNHLMALPFPADHRSRSYLDGRPQPLFFHGLVVLFVPWIEGLFVLPELPDAMERAG